MAKVLTTANLCFIKDYFTIVFTLDEEFILKIIGNLYYFSLEIVKETTIN